MTTKMNKIFFPVILVALFSLLVVSCGKDDYTGYSTMKITSPTGSVTPGFTNPVTLVENDSTFTFTVTLDKAQLVDVKVNVKQVGGTASAADYELSGSVYFTAGSTSATGTIKILRDCLIEDTETLTIQVGDNETANATLVPVTFDFNILNTTSSDLNLGLEWAPSTTTTDNSGNTIAPTALADMRLLITDSPYTTIVDGSDGGSFETYDMTNDLPDGEYLIVADFYDALTSPTRDLDLTLTYEQCGAIAPSSFSFPAAINTGSLCEANYYIMAKVTKSGGNYTIEKVGSPTPVTSLVGTWNGIDVDDESGYNNYPSRVVTSAAEDGTLQLYGLGLDWMFEFWGETVIDSANVSVGINWCAGELTIPSQYYLHTTYNGAEQTPYNLVGTGTFDLSGTYPTMTITYDLDQDGFSTAGWCYANGYLSTPLFVANLTLDPNGKVISMTTNFKPEMLKNKPVH